MASPFRPLQSFIEGERALFFGREREISELVALVGGERPSVLLAGESGVGKSSLVRAGLLPYLESRGTTCQYFDASAPGKAELLLRGGKALLVIDDVGAALDDGPRFEQLLGLLRKAAGVEGVKLLFVIDDEDLWRLEALESKTGRISQRMRIGRFDQGRVAEIIERTVLAGGAYFEAGLSQEIAADLARGGDVSPSAIQVAAHTVVALRLNSAKAYRQSGGAEVLAWRFFELACDGAGGRVALRALAEVASLPSRGVASLESIAQASSLHLAQASSVMGRLESERIVRHVAEGYTLGSEWLRSDARVFTGEARGRRVATRLLLRRKIEAGRLLRPREILTARRDAGTLEPDEARLVRRSVQVAGLALAILLAAPIFATVAVYRGYARSYYFDAGAAPGAPVVVRLGKPRMGLGALPHTPPFGAVIADSGFVRAAVGERLPEPAAEGDGTAWLARLVAALQPLPRGVVALLLDGDLKPLERAYEGAAARPVVVDIVGAVGKGGPDELAILKRALGDASEDVRRRAVSASASLERRVPGAATALLEAALEDASSSTRALAIAEVTRLPDEQSAPLLASALARTTNPIVRHAALEAIGAQVARTPTAAAALGRAMLGAARSDAATLLSHLLDGSGPTAQAAEDAVVQVALDPKAPEDARLEALRMLRRRPTTPAALQKIAGSPKVTAAAMPLIARANPQAAAEQVIEAMHGAAPLRAAAAATLGLLPRTADTDKQLHILENDSAVEVRAEAVRALPVMGAAALPLLLKEAKGGGVEVERAAVEALGAQAAKLGAGAVVQALETIGKTARVSTRKAAIDALARVAETKPSLAVGALGRLVRDKVPEVRQNAAVSLGDLVAHRPEAGRDAVAALRGAAKDLDAETRRHAAESLGRARGPLAASAAKALAAFVADPDATVRNSAASALGGLGAAARGGAVWAALVADKDASVRAAGRKAARDTGTSGAEIDRVLLASFAAAAPPERIDVATTAAVLSAPATLRAALSDPEASVRRAAAERVTGLDEAHAAPLVAALADADAAVRVAAVRGLVGAKAAAALSQAALSPDLDVRMAALEALGQVGGKQAEEALAAALSDGSEHVRVAAVRGLGRLGVPAAALLERALGDASLDVREAAVVGLGAAWVERPPAELRALVVDETHADLRYAAALALARRSDPQRGQGTDATKILDDVIKKGPPLGRLAALLGRAFAARPEAMAPLLHVLREGG